MQAGETRNELWSMIAMGIADVIRFDSTLGIAGEVLTWGKVIKVRDAYGYAKFNPKIDKKTGYTTRTVLCIPMKRDALSLLARAWGLSG